MQTINLVLSFTLKTVARNCISITEFAALKRMQKPKKQIMAISLKLLFFTRKRHLRLVSQTFAGDLQTDSFF